MIIQADILTWAATYDGPKFHALLCDAPYHLTEITARFGAEDAAPAQYGKDGAFQRLSKGFMGKTWDGVDENGVGIAFNPDMWRAVAQHLHPGAYLFVFAGTLNDDLISMAMRAAGLRKHHKGLAWGYGSGFPKATNTADQIDAAAFRDWLDTHPREAAILKSLSQAARVARKARQPYKALEERCKRAVLMLKRRAGLLPHVVSTRKHAPKFDAAGHGYREKDNGYNSKERESFDVTAPATELAQTWAGHRYGLQALKPAVEPILVFQKPYERSAIDSITATGAGALNIDQARIETDEQWSRNNRPGQNGIFNASGGPAESNPAGRWPANLVLSHSPSCNGHCTPGCPVAALGEQSGVTTSGAHHGELDTPKKNSVYGKFNKANINTFEANTGTAARFFFNADYLYERLEGIDNAFGDNCVICGCNHSNHGIISEKHHESEDSTCEHAKNAESYSSPQNRLADSVVTHAPLRQQPKSAGKSEASSIYARNVASSSSSSQETSENIALSSATGLQVEQIAHNAKFVASLCDLCATAIAQSLVAMRRGNDPALPLGALSIPERTRQILIHSLALLAVSQERSGIIPTIADLNTLFGFVVPAIESSQKPPVAADPVLYFPKSSKGEREAGLDPRQLALLGMIERDEATINDGREKPIDNPYQRGETTRRNIHALVAP